MCILSFRDKSLVEFVQRRLRMFQVNKIMSINLSLLLSIVVT